MRPGRGNSKKQFWVAPAGGGEVMEVLLAPKDDAAMGPSGYSAGNPILFPFPNRVVGGKYTFEGKAHQLDVNETARGNHIHGLVSSRSWTTAATGADESDGAW